MRAVEFLQAVNDEQIWLEACDNGRAFARSLQGSCSEAVDTALSTHAGCEYLRWLARRMFGEKADEAIDVARLRFAAVTDDDEYFRAITRDAAEMIRDVAVAWEAQR